MYEAFILSACSNHVYKIINFIIRALAVTVYKYVFVNITTSYDQCYGTGRNWSGSRSTVCPRSSYPFNIVSIVYIYSGI